MSIISNFCFDNFSFIFVSDVIDLYEHISSQDFDWTALYPFVAEAYDKEEEFEKAYELYKAAYPDFNDDPSFLQSYCHFLIEDGKLAEAKEIAQVLLQLEPEEQQWIDLIERFK